MKAYKTIDLEIEYGDRTETVEIPFTIGLMRELEDMYGSVQKMQNGTFFKTKETDENIHEVYLEFMRRYVKTDEEQLSPDFPIVFFSSVLDSYLGIMGNYGDLVKLTMELGESLAKRNQEETDQESAS